MIFLPARRVAVAAVSWLVAAAPLPAPALPAAPPSAAPAAPVIGPPAPAIRRANNPAIVDQFMMLAFDADPVTGTPARDVFARWTDDVRIYVSGDPPIQRAVDMAAATLAKLTRLPILRVAGGQPNIFLAVTATPAEDFGGPLRRLLSLAFADDQTTVDRFIEAVVATQACWVVPVWADVPRTTIKAAVIGIDARQGYSGVDRCITQKLAASLGLLGPSGYLPRSVFTPQSGATKLSFEDAMMLRVLYDPVLTPGMSREQTAAAAAAVMQRIRPR
jgi:hypothetical protein